MHILLATDAQLDREAQAHYKEKVENRDIFMFAQRFSVGTSSQQFSNALDPKV